MAVGTHAYRRTKNDWTKGVSTGRRVDSPKQAFESVQVMNLLFFKYVQSTFRSSSSL